MALDLAPTGVFENNQFFLPITKGLILCSARLLLISSHLSVKYPQYIFSTNGHRIPPLPSMLLGSAPKPSLEFIEQRF